jgi:LAO/AO transport system kinase
LAARTTLARLISRIEAAEPGVDAAVAALPDAHPDSWVLGVTGPPGAGKSTLINAMVTVLRGGGQRVAVLAVDPSSPCTGGAVLGDRIRMSQHLGDDGVYIRSLASRGHIGGLATAVPLASRALLGFGFGRVLIETIGVGQAEVDVARYADTTILLSAPGLGDSIQAIKAGVLEVADILVVTKADRDGAPELARDLTAAVRLGRTPADAWRTPVLCTQADTGAGVTELVAEIERHRAFLVSSGQLERRRAERRLAEWRVACRLLLEQQLAAGLAGAVGRDLAERVAGGEVAPAAAAAARYDHLRQVDPRLPL